MIKKHPICLQKDLPEYVFSVPYQKFLFFEDGVLSDRRHLDLVQKVISGVFPEANGFDIFILPTMEYKGHVDSNSDWFQKVEEKVVKPHADRDAWVALIGSNSDWAIFQRNSMQLGVFALDSRDIPQDLTADIEKNFVDLGQIRKIIDEAGDQYRNCNTIYGLGFLEHLVNNFVALPRH